VDDRSGLLLRRGLEILASHTVQRASRRGEPVSLIVIDLDVSEPEDRSPWLAGGSASAATDSVVELVTLAVCEELRASDLAARLPYDEIVVLLADTDEKAAALVAARLQDQLRRAAGRSFELPPFELEISAASLDPGRDVLSLEELLRRAEPLGMTVAGGARGPLAASSW